MDGVNRFIQLLLLFTCSLSVWTVRSAQAAAGSPLSDHIHYYEGLHYDTDTIKNQHERLRRSNVNALNTHERIITLSFFALNRTFSLNLWPSRDVFAPEAQFLVHTDKGVVPSQYDPASFYRGRLSGQALSRVHGHIQNGVFDGEITTESGETYHIEYSHKFPGTQLPEDTHSIIYSSKDIILQRPGQQAGCALKRELLRKLEAIQATAKPIPKPRKPITDQEYTNILSERLRKKRDISKRVNTANGGRFCQILVAVDHLFLANVAGGNEMSAISEVATIMSSSQTIFQATDFDGDGQMDIITPQLVRTEVLNADSYGGRFRSSNIAVNTFLDLWSQIDHQEFCLALLLTYRDFSDGVLGLAWVAQPPGGSSGGICEGRVSLSVGVRSLNTAIVTYLNYGSRQPRGVVTITVAHEFGHNFGSSHDPESAQCAPGGSNGNYIMYPRATDGTQRNNDLFSPCSISAINTVLQTKATCFTDDGAFCGNRIREGDERCDCGIGDQSDCNMFDSCCEVGRCQLRAGSQCSAADGCCVSCHNASAGYECSPDTECAHAVLCPGNDSFCPQPEFKNVPCNDGTRFCENGQCTGSVCKTKGWEECQCTASDELCHVCCLVNNTCTSTFTLSANRTGNFTVPGQYRDSGRSCNNFQGYCSDETPPTCIGVNNEETLNDLLDIFTLDTLNSVVAWLRTYWWIPIIVIVVIIIIIVLLHLTYRKRKPIKKAARKASLTVRRGSTSGGGAASGGRNQQGGGRNQQGGRRNQPIQGGNRNQPDLREILPRLKKFFPSCDTDVLAGIYQQSDKSETKTVKRLLSLGFRMKKVPMPRL